MLLDSFFLNGGHKLKLQHVVHVPGTFWPCDKFHLCRNLGDGATSMSSSFM